MASDRCPSLPIVAVVRSSNLQIFSVILRGSINIQNEMISTTNCCESRVYDPFQMCLNHAQYEFYAKLLLYINQTILQRGRIACNAERCNTYSNSVCPSVRHTLVPYPDE